MFHYRPAISSRQLRFVVAAIVAIALHIGLIGLNTDRKQVFNPHISFPRSVTVFLGSQSSPQPPADMAAKVQKTEHVEENIPTPTTKTEKFLSEKTVASEETESPVQSSQQLKESKKPLKELVDKNEQITFEKIDSAMQQNKNKPNSIKPDESGVSPQAKENTEHLNALAGRGVQHPGTLQIAYPRYRLNSPPTYPGLARKRGQEGKVVLQVLVNKEGRVDDLKIDVSSGFRLLDRAAEKAVRKWHFEPARKGEEKMPMWVRVPVSFKLKK